MCFEPQEEAGRSREGRWAAGRPENPRTIAQTCRRVDTRKPHMGSNPLKLNGLVVFYNIALLQIFGRSILGLRTRVL